MLLDLAPFFITFRESLEAALVIGIILAYLEKTKNTKMNRHVYFGIVVAMVASLATAYLFGRLEGGFGGVNEQLFEGTTMFVAAILLSWMILWMMSRKQVAYGIHKRVDAALFENSAFSLFAFSLVAVYREGVETVIFLASAAKLAGALSVPSAVLGVIAALILGFLVFEASIKVNIKTFFNVTSVILVLFAAGLVSHGVHEYQEAGLLPEGTVVWDVNNILNEQSTTGLMAKSLFGYNGNPTGLEVIAYWMFILAIYTIYRLFIASPAVGNRLPARQ